MDGITKCSLLNSVIRSQTSLTVHMGGSLDSQHDTVTETANTANIYNIFFLSINYFIHV
jgi:hypothetical protein